MNADALIDRIFQLSPQVRYVALRLGHEVVSRQREGIADASDGVSDRFEELLVNPALVTLTQQRGAIDCGGLRYLLVRYGKFFQFVRPYDGDGHVSVALEAGSDVIGIAGRIDALLGRAP
jgi:hypothetical protein